MPLLKSIKIYSGRVAQGKRPVGNNQQGRASDINPIIDWVNQRSDTNTAANAVTGVASSATINTISGTITAPLTTGAGGTATYTINNSVCTANSTVLVTISNYTGANGAPLVIRVVPATGSFVIHIRNLDTGNALTNNTVFKFIIL